MSCINMTWDCSDNQAACSNLNIFRAFVWSAPHKLRQLLFFMCQYKCFFRHQLMKLTNHFCMHIAQSPSQSLTKFSFFSFPWKKTRLNFCNYKTVLLLCITSSALLMGFPIKAQCIMLLTFVAFSSANSECRLLLHIYIQV